MLPAPQIDEEPSDEEAEAEEFESMDRSTGLAAGGEGPESEEEATLEEEEAWNQWLRNAKAAEEAGTIT